LYTVKDETEECTDICIHCFKELVQLDMKINCIIENQDHMKSISF